MYLQKRSILDFELMVLETKDEFTKWEETHNIKWTHEEIELSGFTVVRFVSQTESKVLTYAHVTECIMVQHQSMTQVKALTELYNKL